MASTCAVNWCVALATRGVYCALHAQRPAFPNERHSEQWCQRIRQEDASAAREKVKAEREAAAAKAGKSRMGR
jgi:hypothetical protein